MLMRCSVESTGTGGYMWAMSRHGGAEGEASGNLEANPFGAIIGAEDPGRGDIREVSLVGDALRDACPLMLWPIGFSFTPRKVQRLKHTYDLPRDCY